MLPEGKLLRVFVSENDQYQGMPLYEWIITRARREHLAGATVLRGMEGFGEHNRLHTAKILCLSQNLPIVIEIIDTAERIHHFHHLIDGILKEGLVTIEKVEAYFYRKEHK